MVKTPRSTGDMPPAPSAREYTLQEAAEKRSRTSLAPMAGLVTALEQIAHAVRAAVDRAAADSTTAPNDDSGSTNNPATPRCTPRRHAPPPRSPRPANVTQPFRGVDALEPMMKQLQIKEEHIRSLTEDLHEARAAHKEALARAERAERLITVMQKGGAEAGGGVQHGGETARDGEDGQVEEGEGGGVCVRTKHALISNRIVALMTEAASNWFEGSLSLRMRRTRRAFDNFRQTVEEQIAGNIAESEGEEQEQEGFEGGAECEPGDSGTPNSVSGGLTPPSISKLNIGGLKNNSWAE